MSHKTGILRIETKLLSFKKLFLSISLSATCEEIGILFLFTWIFLVLYLSLSHNFKFRFTEVKPFFKRTMLLFTVPLFKNASKEALNLV